MALANFMVTLGLLYAGTGLLFALAFVTRGVTQIDPAARGTSYFFRVLLIPGATVCWPLLAWRWRQASEAPPLETNAHRQAATRDENLREI